jgi:hypothetical protein
MRDNPYHMVPMLGGGWGTRLTGPGSREAWRGDRREKREKEGDTEREREKEKKKEKKREREKDVAGVWKQLLKDPSAQGGRQGKGADQVRSSEGEGGQGRGRGRGRGWRGRG